MSDLELIKDFGRDTVLRNRALVGFSRRAASEGLDFPDAKVLIGPGQATAYYNFTDALARHMPIDIALDAWRDTLERLREMLGDWGHDPENVKDFAGYHRRLLAELVAKAEAEARAHEETLHLLDSPANAKRLADAIAEADAGLARELTPEGLRDARGHQN